MFSENNLICLDVFVAQRPNFFERLARCKDHLIDSLDFEAKGYAADARASFAPWSPPSPSTSSSSCFFSSSFSYYRERAARSRSSRRGHDASSCSAGHHFASKHEITS